MAFAMRDEWQEEPASTTGAEYVEPSATELIRPGQRGVLLFDAPLGAADATLAAIASVTSLPVTAVVYSHFHADHVGGSRRLFELLAAAPPRVIASSSTASWMSRFPSDLPRPGRPNCPTSR